jgi:exosome complex RNA-binding protein Rrp4
VLVLGLTVSISSPAHAILGLSTCEKVKKRVLSLESELNSQLIYWNRKISQQADPKLIPKLEAFESANLVRELWKLQYNNPKCFTRTQNIEIKARKNLTTGDFVLWYVNNIKKNTKKCQSFEQAFEPTPDCIIREELKINKVYSMPSIYGF